MQHSSLDGVTAPQQRKGIATKNRRGNYVSKKKSGSEWTNFYYFIFFLHYVKNGHGATSRHGRNRDRNSQLDSQGSRKGMGR
jgi:hypothetical protein